MTETEPRLTSAVTPVILKKVFLFPPEATKAGKLLAGVKAPQHLWLKVFFTHSLKLN